MYTNMFLMVRLMKFCLTFQGNIRNNLNLNSGMEVLNFTLAFLLTFSKFRRAHENKGILVKLNKEKKLLRRELKDRVLSGRLMHRPKGEYIPI